MAAPIRRNQIEFSFPSTMSRIIVKNIPSYLTESRLREHFASKGTITDAKVLHSKDGTSRRFAFIGFKSEDQAHAAQEYFNRTYVDASRITVEVVSGTKDAPPPRPHKRPRLSGPEPNLEVEERKKSKEKDAVPVVASPPDKATARFEEYRKVMQRGKKSQAWADGDALPDATASAKKAKKKRRDEQVADAVGGPGDAGPSQPVSDLDWMKRKMKSSLFDEDDGGDKAFEQSDDDIEPHPQTSAETQSQTTPPNPNVEGPLSSRLFIRNLAFSCTESELEEHFKLHGEVKQAHLPLDPSTKAPKGIAYVTFASVDEATAAREALDGTTFQGRLLHILPAVDLRRRVETQDRQSVKAQKAEKRKQTAGKEFNWAMLYMNADAVASSIAERMNIPKTDILNPESGDAAVKLALAETHVISETKKFFEDEGVDLESFSSRARSDTIILIKNIPFGTNAEELRDMFSPHGDIIRLLVPPAGTIAVAEFAHPADASKAFKAVAYRRLKNSVVYLEKGPLNMFKSSSDVPSSSGAPKPVQGGVVRIGPSDEAPGSEDVPRGSTLFVKNLAFSTTTDRLRSAFAHLPGFAFARVHTKPDPRRPDATLSAGYGFAGFASPESARRALRAMHGTVLDGHELSLAFAGRGTEDQQPTGAASSATIGAKTKTAKMVVKNIPFEATKRDIRALFGAHGTLKSVRLPKTFDARSRGFAFLEFASRAEAEHALATLRHTHLLGRHLVLEWAADDAQADVDKLREKIRTGFGDGGELPGRKRKLEIEDDAGDGEEL